jgi:hypothetical protein
VGAAPMYDGGNIMRDIIGGSFGILLVILISK